jgi:uncharacterized alpha-E superfamily protein
MLSRVANSLFWLTRYVERAENTARFLAVTESYALEVGGVSRVAAEACWSAARAHFGLPPEPRDPGNLRELILDPQLPNSVFASIGLARENARSIRDAIASEMWEGLNVLHLRLQEAAAAGIVSGGEQALLHRVQETSHLLQGLRDNTMVRADEWHFLRLGRFVERADNTLRLLDTMVGHPALQVASAAGQDIDTLHLAATLRACTAFEAFAREGQSLSLEGVTGFLLLDARFPRSVEFCVHECGQALHALSRTPPDLFSNDAEQLCGRLVAELRFASIEEVIARGLHDYLLRTLRSVAGLERAIGQEYFP